MPANEQTWRNTKLLHVVFGLSSLLMLVVTIWMLAADHNREFKRYMKGFQRLETWTTAARVSDQRSADYLAEESRLEAELERAQLEVPPADLVEQFLSLAEPLAKANRYDLAAVRSAYEKLTAPREAGAIQTALAHRREFLAATSAVVARAKFDEDKIQQALKFRRADLDSDKSYISLGVEYESSDEDIAEWQRRVDEVKAGEGGVDPLTIVYQDASTHRKALQAIAARISKDEDEANKRLSDHQAGLNRVFTQIKEIS